jgi:hypothetical protein
MFSLNQFLLISTEAMETMETINTVTQVLKAAAMSYLPTMVEVKVQTQ